MPNKISNNSKEQKPKKQISFNSQLYSFVCKRLKLKRREKIIFYRLLGFLLRNDKPFPYPIKSMSELTGYNRSSIFESINLLEKLRLISRIGYTSSVKYTKGSLMVKSCSLVQNRRKRDLIKTQPLVQKLDESIPASPETGYKKTYSSLKLKDIAYLSQNEKQQIKFYSENQNFPIPESMFHVKEIIEELRQNRFQI